MKKGEQGEQPYAKFREQATRARANGKIVLVRQILADKDWWAKAWYLERCWPNEFGRSAERPLPTVEPEPKKVSIAVVLNTGGKTLEELVNFPMIESKPPSSPAPEPATDADPDADGAETP